MKYLLITAILFSAISCNGTAETKKEEPVVKTATTTDAKDPAKKEEDCDDKAKKPIEIKEETISLSGNTGCSLDEVKP